MSSQTTITENAADGKAEKRRSINHDHFVDAGGHKVSPRLIEKILPLDTFHVRLIDTF